MARTLSIPALAACHAAMGGMLGIGCYAALAASRVPGIRDLDAATSVVLLSALASWMTVGAGLSGFILANVARAADRS
jgi:hypothetical protein